MAAYLTDKVMKNSKEAIAMYKELKQKFQETRIMNNTEKAGDLADNYLAQLGVYNTPD
jgi:hypothetical protein